MLRMWRGAIGAVGAAGAPCGSLMAGDRTGMLDSRRAPAGTHPLRGSGVWWVSRRTNHHPGARERTRNVSYLCTKVDQSAGGGEDSQSGVELVGSLCPVWEDSDCVRRALRLRRAGVGGVTWAVPAPGREGLVWMVLVWVWVVVVIARLRSRTRRWGT